MRNTTLTIIKALAITLVVVAHSCSPMYLSRFAYMICVSLFFMASGYCFNTKYLTDETTFVKHRLKGLYLPFLKWSVILLVLHNMWFHLGILSEQYGNAAGGVTHPLNLHQWLQALWSITLSMSGYDQFLGGAFWFFRAMLVSSIAFLVLFKIFGNIERLKEKHTTTALLIAATGLALALWQTSDSLRWTGIAQGGYREFMGIFFLASGFCYRQYETWLTNPVGSTPIVNAEKVEHPQGKKLVAWCDKALHALLTLVHWLGHTPYVSLLISGVIIALLVVFPHPSMATKAHSLTEVLYLALSGVVGFSFIRNTATFLNNIGRDKTAADTIAASPAGHVRRALLYIGDNTLYIFGWHMLAFKVVSMIKVGVYGLPWQMVGGHPVVHSHEGDIFWLFYTIVGIALPLGGIWLYRYMQRHYTAEIYFSCAKVALHYIWNGTKYISRQLFRGLALICRYAWRALHWLCIGLWHSVYNFCQSFVDTIREGADVDQDE